MQPPFVFDKPVSGAHFAGRKWLTDNIILKLTSLRNLILVSPRGWGKASLASEVGIQLTQQNYEFRFIFVDLHNVFSKEAFIDALINEIALVPGTNYSVIRHASYLNEDPLDLPEIFAMNNRIKLIVCIADFQNIFHFNDSLEFQNKLYLRWRIPRHCAYLILGSNPQMHGDLIKSPFMPISKIGRIYKLGRLRHNEFTDYIQNRFTQTGKHISQHVSSAIILYADYIPFYCQLLAWHCWTRTRESCTMEIVDESVYNISSHFNLHFENLTYSLTDKQLKFLEALVFDEFKPYSNDNIAKYKLSSCGHVARINKSLIKKEVITNEWGEILFLNPFYRHWLAHSFFRNSHG
jgi:hypothetical protein